MKQIYFPLTRPVRVTPLSGTSDVSISTTGDVLVSECEPTEHRVRSITIVETQRATMKRSPQGLYKTVKIRLPIEQATEHEFHRQLSMLFKASPSLSQGEGVKYQPFDVEW